MSNVPSQPATLYAHDEDILIHAGTDFGQLCPSYQQLAQAADGVFLAADPWTLTSATIDFAAAGVQPNHVVQLTKPISQYVGGGHFLAVDSVSGGSVTLRRPYKAPGVGQPPAPAAGLTAVTFNVATLDPQIAEATYDLQQRFGIDDNVAAVGIQRSSSWIYDLQVLRVATVYEVLLSRYSIEGRSTAGDFALKIARFQAKLADAIGRITVRFGPVGTSSESTGIFSCRVCR